MEAQSLAVKRAQVEFHNFASLGEPERVLEDYAQDNVRRGGIIRKHWEFIRPISPFLEIGANAGHSSYLLANEFGAQGFALDISEHALRHGRFLQEAWHMPQAPVRLAGDAVRLPFRDNSLRFVMACQMLSQFMDIEQVFLEVKRVLMPGGVFFFTEEPLRRMLTLRVHRAPYEETMKPWERFLHRQGLLGFLVRDVIGAHQEESFGIRQNHTMGLKDWHNLIAKHFVDHRYEIFVPERGWAEKLVKDTAVALHPQRTVWRAARLLGGTLSAFCKKEGTADLPQNYRFEDVLRCPDCGGRFVLDAERSLECVACGYEAREYEGVYNLLATPDRNELYPGERDDIIDFTLDGHERLLGKGFHELEGIFGNRYRWMEASAFATLQRVSPGPQRLRIRGHAPEGKRFEFRVTVNGHLLPPWTIDRNGLFVLEADLPDAERYELKLECAPEWSAPPDQRRLTVSLSMIRLVPQ